MAAAEFNIPVPTAGSITIDQGAPVPFSVTGTTAGTGISNVAGTITIAEPGTYLVNFAVNVSDEGQLVLSVNGAEQAYTTAGNAAPNTPIIGSSIITVAAANTTLSVDNPTSAAGALTINQDPTAGANEIAARVTIVRLA